MWEAVTVGLGVHMCTSMIVFACVYCVPGRIGVWRSFVMGSSFMETSGTSLVFVYCG